MNRTGRILAAALPWAALLSLSLALTACGGGGPAPVSPPPSSARTAAEQAAVQHWLAKTNAMWTQNNFAALDEITTAEMRTIYLAEQRGASLPSNASRQPFQLTGLSITIPCQAGRPGVFVAYGDTDVFDLGPAMHPMAMVFERVDGRWKLAAAINRPARGWPALCTEGSPPSAPPAVAAGDFAPELARVLTHATTGSAETTATAAPFAVNDFFAGSGSINAQAARQTGQDRRGGVSFTQGFTTTVNPTLALPLAGGRGFWMIGILTQTGRYASATGLRTKNWPDGNQVATPRPAVVHHETDTFITTYTAIDPPRSAGATLTLDGFFGWPLLAVAS
jgi:predicted small lipoprotein YifL